ncbi:MAG: hypothetical protein LBF97_01695 [Elusimicrobiota bacterium]|jgi:hypothetical protein|nr:hypothetical protein [Elusimicrobiota bacterium]
MKIITITFNGEEQKETVVEKKSLSEAFLELGVEENKNRREAVQYGKPYVVKINNNTYKFILYDDARYNEYCQKAKKKYLERKIA